MRKKELTCVFAFSSPAPCHSPRKYVFCRLAQMFLPLDEIINAVAKALTFATTGKLPEGYTVADLPDELKEFLRKRSETPVHYRV